MVGNLPTIFKFLAHAGDGVMANFQPFRDLPIALLRRVFQLFGDERAGVIKSNNWTFASEPDYPHASGRD